jgi:hypothetical protein
MQKDIFQLIPDFDQLLENKTFDELSISEKKAVMQCITPEEYEQYRNAFVMLKTEIKPKHRLKPADDLRKVLLNAFDKKYSHKPDNYFKRIVTYKLPVYQIGIAAALLFAFVWFIDSPTEKINYVTTCDTIYVEKPVYNEIVKKQEVNNETIVATKTTEKQVPKKRIVNEKPNYYKEYLANNILSKMQTVSNMKKGKNIGKDSVLLAWITPVY